MKQSPSETISCSTDQKISCLSWHLKLKKNFAKSCSGPKPGPDDTNSHPLISDLLLILSSLLIGLFRSVHRDIQTAVGEENKLRISSNNFIPRIVTTLESWRSVVGRATRLRAGRSGVRIPVRVGFFSLIQKRPDLLWSPPILLLDVCRGYFPRGNWRGV